MGEYNENALLLTILRTIQIRSCVVLIRLVLFTLASPVKKTQLTDAPCVCGRALGCRANALDTPISHVGARHRAEETEFKLDTVQKNQTDDTLVCTHR